MQKIGASTASANALGEFTEGNSSTGIPATLLKAAWLNAIQRELVSVVEGAGLTLNGADDSQLLKAIQALQTWAKLNGKPTTILGFGITDAYDKTYLNAMHALKANLASPVFTGTPTAATAAPGTNSLQLATTAFVAAAINAVKATTLAGYGITDAYTISQIDSFFSDPWTMQPIGVPIPIFTHITGVAIPPTNKSYRYISLTAADAYNTGVLTGETVSGAAPLVVASAVISLAGSPMNGQSVSLVNTERRVIRAGQSGLLDADQYQGHRMAAIASSFVNGGSLNVAAGSAYAGGVSVNATTGGSVTDTVNGTPRVGDETRAKSIGATFYMRIK